jgi:hypothetical protein
LCRKCHFAHEGRGEGIHTPGWTRKRASRSRGLAQP